MKLYWLLIGFLVANGLATSPTQAEEKLTSWQLDEPPNLNRPISQWVENAINQSQTAKVEVVNLVNNQLLLQTDKSLTPMGEWDHVVISIQVSSKVQIGDKINQSSNNILAMSWRQHLTLSQAEIGENQSPQRLYQSQTYEFSYETREIELENFGIKMRIPKTRRAMATNDGAVEILTNEDYNLLRCSQIEPGLCIGRGYSSLRIRLLPNSKNSSLLSRVAKIVNSNDCYPPKVDTFSLENLEGLQLIAPPHLNCSGAFDIAISWFFIPDVGIIEMSLTGDAYGDSYENMKLLNRYLSGVEYLK